MSTISNNQVGVLSNLCIISSFTSTSFNASHRLNCLPYFWVLKVHHSPPINRYLEQAILSVGLDVSRECFGVSGCLGDSTGILETEAL